MATATVYLSYLHAKKINIYIYSIYLFIFHMRMCDTVSYICVSDLLLLETLVLSTFKWYQWTIDHFDSSTNQAFVPKPATKSRSNN